MDFGLSEEEALIQKTARDFADGELRPHFRDRENAGEVPASVRTAYHTLGLSLIDAPEEVGGSGLGSFARSLVLEEIAAGDAGSALALDGLGPALYPLIEMGSVAVIAPLIAILPEGRAALLVDTEDRFTVSGDTVTGTAPWAPVQDPSWVVVLKGDDAYIVQDGVESEPVQSQALAASGSCELRFNEAPVHLTLHSPAGAQRAVAKARLYVASVLVGVMREAREYSSKYAMDRVAFGKPVAHHQGAAFMIAEMAMGVDAARMAVWRGTDALDRTDGGALEAAAAYTEAAQQAVAVTINAVQLLGGHGFMTDHPVEKWMREARTLSLLYGGADQSLIDESAAVAA